MDWIALGIALLGIALAVYIPLRVEYERRPRLRIERADDANQAAPGMQNWRIVHVRIVNDPISGRLAKLLLRNTATGCRVQLGFRSRSDSTVLGPVRASWSATPEPIQNVFDPGPPATVTPFWDPEKEPGRFTYDVSPGSYGETVAVAIKHDGDNECYAFGPELYRNLPGPLKALR